MKKHFIYTTLLLICILLSSFASPFVLNIPLSKEANPSYLSDLEREVIEELNLARTKPKIYAEFLASYSSFFVGHEVHEPGKTIIITQEGRNAVNEVIRFLKNQKPLVGVSASKGMSKGANDMVRMQETTTQTGHQGRDGSTFAERISRYGTWNGSCSENIDYGNNNARRIVMALIVDDGVASRGHRMSIFEPRFRKAGVSFGSHKAYNYMCVIEFAVGYTEK